MVALALCGMLLPWGTAPLSMAEMLLVLIWLVRLVRSPEARVRSRDAFRPSPVSVFLSFLGLHILGLGWTTDLEWGMDLVRILAPVLVFGVVLGCGPRLKEDAYRGVLWSGAWSVVISTVLCVLLVGKEVTDHRSLSVFISHIRLALLLVLAFAVFLLVRPVDRRWWPVQAAGALWSLYFLLRLGSFQGLFMVATIMAILLWRHSHRWSPVMRVAMRAALLLLPAALLVTFGAIWHRLDRDPAGSGFMERSAGGERYMHDPNNPQREGGRHVWANIAWAELHRTWPLRSEMGLADADGRGHAVYGTLFRYLTSMGLPKDSVGVMMLSDADVRRIEQGIANVNQGKRWRLLERFEEVMLEVAHYRVYGDANGHSVTMRMEYRKVGWTIAKAHWLTGVGTGGTRPAFAQAYERLGSTLRPEWRHRAHDQLLTLWISFGVFGMVWCVFSWWWPAWRLGAWRDPLFIAFAVVLGVSFLADDTLETQTGATVFALYYALFVFAAPRTPDRGSLSPARPSTPGPGRWLG